MVKDGIVDGMAVTGEREFPSMPGTTEGICPLHLQRYEFAAAWTTGRKVADIACGTGYGSLLLDALHYTGIDYDPMAVDFANRHYSGDGVEFLVGNAESLSVDQMFDVVVSFETVEHLNDAQSYLRWVAAHSRMFIGSVPSKADEAGSPLSPFHVREYGVADLEEILGAYWKHVDIAYQSQGHIIYPACEGDPGNLIFLCQGAKE